MPDFSERKQALNYPKSEGVGDSGETTGENRGVSVKLPGRIVRPSGPYYEVSGEPRHPSAA